MSYYETLYTGGPCDGKKKAYIHLYANTSNEDGAVNSTGIVAQAIDNGMNQLVNHGAIDYYEILRFRVEDYSYPGIEEMNVDTEKEFKDWLKGDADGGDTNDTGSNLYSITGVHHLVESFSCDPSGNGGEYEECGSLGFSSGIVSWSSVKCDNDIARNAAIQEPVHQLTDAALVSTDDSGDEHTWGKINYYNDATPMLTFHESESAHQGTCSSSYSWGYTYTQSLTQCTKDAVEETGMVCSDQSC